jgi:hypothetical protein
MIPYEFIKVTYRLFRPILSQVILMKGMNRVLHRDILSPQKLPVIIGKLSFENLSLGDFYALFGMLYVKRQKVLQIWPDPYLLPPPLG